MALWEWRGTESGAPHHGVKVGGPGAVQVGTFHGVDDVLYGDLDAAQELCQLHVVPLALHSGQAQVKGRHEA